VHPHLRVARATDHFDEILRFYRDGLGFSLLGEFRDHAGFDGMMLGLAGAGYHLEFTREHGRLAGRAPGRENLLVFYVPEADAYAGAVARMTGAGYAPVPSHNPYWDQRGKTFEDADGYRVVLFHGSWENVPTPM
jgi:catechol 2,3-dioxygenase-like lactoylglutathione lyase family enzyme